VAKEEKMRERERKRERERGRERERETLYYSQVPVRRLARYEETKTDKLAIVALLKV
jgi:hypothetical protein